MNHHDIVIVAAKRTPIGAMLGKLSTLSAPLLHAESHKAALQQARIPAQDIHEVISGCVLQAGIGQAPARQAAMFAGIPDSVPATTINKMCGSGMKALMLAYDQIRLNPRHILLAGGMESMSQAPYLLKKARSGYRLGHGEIIDHMFLDGLEDAYDKGKLMGYFAEQTAKEYHISRADLDEFAHESMTKALLAQQMGHFQQELTPVMIKTGKTEELIDQDECPDTNKLPKISQLKPAFVADGAITAANSSAIADGAASLILMDRATANAHGLQPLARIVAHATHAHAPQWFTTAPIDAIKKVLHEANWQINDVDLFEINEAFAVVTLACIKQLKLNPQGVNIYGGACALGHPIGASGARVIVTLLHALKQQQKRTGVAALCIGGGEATAVAIERLD